MNIITIPGEALFDVLQTNTANFHDDYRPFTITIGKENSKSELDGHNIDERTWITIKKKPL